MPIDIQLSDIHVSEQRKDSFKHSYDQVFMPIFYGKNAHGKQVSPLVMSLKSNSNRFYFTLVSSETVQNYICTVSIKTSG